MQLQALVIPAGWCVTYNKFFAVDATKESVEKVPTFLTDDLLQLVHKEKNRLIDVGWYPEFDWEEGRFIVTLYEGDCTGKVLYALETKERQSVVESIETLMAKVVAETMSLL